MQVRGHHSVRVFFGTRIPTIIDLSFTKKYNSITGSIIVGIRVALGSIIVGMSVSFGRLSIDCQTYGLVLYLVRITMYTLCFQLWDVIV
jgi:hypothetical protein